MLCRHFFSLFCFALGLFFDLALARVIYVSPLTLAEHKTGNDWHILNVVGDYKGYSVKTAMVDGVGDSEAQCTNGVGDRQWVGPGRNALFSAPCQTNTAKHDQIITVQCLDPTMSIPTLRQGSAQAVFRTNGEVSITTKGHLWAGFSHPSDTKLAQGTLSQNGQHIDVLFSCYSDSRT